MFTNTQYFLFFFSVYTNKSGDFRPVSWPHIVHVRNMDFSNIVHTRSDCPRAC